MTGSSIAPVPMPVLTGNSIRAAAAAALYVVVFLAVALFVRDDPRYAVTSLTSLNQLADNVFGLPFGDPASFATAARDILQTGTLAPAHGYIFRLWPPGIPAIEAVLARLIGTDGPLILCLQIISVALLAFIAVLLRAILRTSLPGTIATMLPLSVIGFPVFRLCLLEPSGIMFGDAFAIELFGIALLIALPTRDKLPSPARAIAAGVCLAVSAYFRPYVETIVVVATILAIGLAALRCLPPIRRTVLPNAVGCVLLVLMTAQLVMLPWRVHNVLDGAMGVPAWTATFTVVAQNALTSRETLLAAGGRFVVDGGGDLACALEPVQCGKTDHPVERVLGVFVRHMPDWLGHKLSIVGSHWFAPLLYFSGLPDAPDSDAVNLCANTIFLLLLISLPGLLYVARRHPAAPLLVLMTVAILASYAVILTLVQIEARYFNFLKFYVLVMGLVLTALVRTRQPGANNPPPQATPFR
jgi:hypothetical protein